MKMELWQLRQRQALPMELKERYTEIRIRDWYSYWKGNVYVSFSGGKDSTVLLHQVRKIYPEIPAVFVNTGLEYPEILSFVKNFENVIWLKPKINFIEVINKYGYPVISKRVARFISDIQNSSDKNKNTVNLRLTGYNRKGIFCPSMKIPNKWINLAYSDIKVSDKCCTIMKKEPFYRYQKETNRMPIMGILASESNMREKQYLNQGCNFYEGKTNPTSMPIAFWNDLDIWEYKEKYGIKFSDIYNIEKSTGCMFCMFGCHLEKGENRFQRMKYTHPKYYDFCINKIGCGKVLDFIGVKY